jgi:Zn-dependent protease
MNEAPLPDEFSNAPDSPSSGAGSRADGMQTYRRKYRLPIFLFLATCVSTFWVGITHWQPMQALALGFSAQEGLMPFRIMLLENWQQGLIYMFAVLLILFCHEMGHFVATMIYKVPASAPIFLPFPINPIGTLGAVIAMQGNQADRKQIFDIGIAGPLAGLVPAIPFAFIGVSQLDLSATPQTGLGMYMPFFLDWLIRWYEIPNYDGIVWLNQLNPWFCAAWVGLLITGLNMMPVGQLDGGHVTFTLFGKIAHTIAQLTIVLAVAFMVYHQHFILILMVTLVLFIGTNHPPTRDDTVPLGPFRWLLGLASLSIPILCFPPLIFKIMQ